MNAASRPELDPPRRSVRKRRLSVADYRRMGEIGIFAPDERVELIDESLVTPPPVEPVHAGLSSQLSSLFVLAANDRAIVRVRGPVRLSDHSEPVPDLTLLRPRGDDYREAHPEPVDTLLPRHRLSPHPDR